MAIARDSAGSLATASATSLTFAHTCTGSDLILFVGLKNDTTTSDICTGVTYNGVAMTRVDYQAMGAGSNEAIYLYYLIGPATGANNVVASFSQSVGISGRAVSYTGVGVNGIDTSGKNFNGSTTSIAKSVTTTKDNAWVTGIIRNNANNTVVADAGCVMTPGDVQGSFEFADSNGAVTPAGAKSIGNSWTGTAEASIVVQAFGPAVSSASPSASPSASVSPSASPSTSPSASVSPSASPSISPSQSASPSASPSSSPSASPSASPSPSPATWTARTKPTTTWTRVR